MMRSHVCQNCRLQLSRRLASPRHPQWQPNATIVSFRTTQSRPDTGTQLPSEQASSEAKETQSSGIKVRYSGVKRRPASEFRGVRQDVGNQHELSQAQDEGGLRIHYRHWAPGTQDDGGTPHPAPVGRYSRSANRSEAQEQLQAEPEAQQYEESGPTTEPDTKKGFAQELNKILTLKKGKHVDAAWDYFNKIYHSRNVPALTDPSLSDVTLLSGGKVFMLLCNSIMKEWIKGNQNVPTPTAVLFRFEQLGIANERIWHTAMATVTDRLLLSMSGTPEETRDTQSILVELLSLWRLLFQRYGTQRDSDPLESISSEWKSLPSPEELTGNYTTLFFGSRLQEFHPFLKTSPQLQFSALSIFNYFYGDIQFPRNIPNSLREQHEPFLRLLTSTLARSKVTGAFRHLSVSYVCQQLPDGFPQSIAEQIRVAPLLAMKKIGMEPSASPDAQSSQLQEYFLKRIARQVQSQANLKSLERLWSEAQVMFKSPEKKLEIPSAVYNAFLSGFMALHQPDHTVQVWNHMIAHDVKPDVKTWNAMLSGCAQAKDLTGLNGVWDRMMRTGVQPDAASWATRVNATIDVHEINAGLAVLDEMGKKWLTAENGQKNPPAKGKGFKKPNVPATNTFVKPSVQVINAAISALIQLPTKGRLTFDTKASYVREVLQWAGNFGIKPDVITYNNLVKLYLSGNDYATAFQLLKQMEKEGIEGDLATHTMLLRVAFDNQKFDSLSHQEQADRVVSLLTSLEASGLKLNQFVYQIAVDRLLKHYANHLAVRTVLDHMQARGLTPSPHILTSLVTHYFAASPPDMRAVDALVARILGPPAMSTDKMLFDRIVEGYAKNGAIAAMLSALDKMVQHGKQPSFQALTEVVRALFQAGEWERARGVVRDVQTETGIARDGPTGGINGRKGFFAVVQGLDPGLLESLAGEHFLAPAAGDARVDGETRGIGRVDAHTLHERPPADEADDEFVLAEHTSYLSDEPDIAPQRHWDSPSDASAGNT